MLKTNKDRKLKLDRDFEPFLTYEGDEIFRNGIFRFNITKILADIESGALKPAWKEKDKKTVLINVPEWFETHWHTSSINETHLPTVVVTKPVIQAEISPGTFTIIDGNHRMEKAFRDDVPTIESYKLRGEQLIPYFADIRSYQSYVDYWNSKLR